MPEDERLRRRPWIDDLTPFGECVGYVPLRNRELRVCGMRNIGVEANGYLRGEMCPLGFKTIARLRADNNAAEPRRARSHKSIETLHLFRVETLGGDPDASMRMRLMQDASDLRQKRKENGGIGVARISARDKDLIDLRKVAKNVTPGAKLRGDGLRFGVIFGHCWVEDGAAQPVFLNDPGDTRHHLHGRQREKRAGGRVVSDRRQDLDGVGAEDRQVANVLFESLRSPCVVGVVFEAITELVSANRKLGS